MRLLFSISLLFLFTSFCNGAVQVAKTITVDVVGNGNFKKIQDAIDSVPSGNNKWTRIHIGAGVYREKVDIPVEKGFILLEGDGASQTSVEWSDFAPMSDPDDNGNKVANTATVSIAAVNFVAKGITFKNSYGNSQVQARAIAALISGDKASFYNCSFIGIQDTVSDLSGRHYFKDCYIEGAVDFIFGIGQSIYEGCTLSTVASKAIAGWVTAQGRNKPDDPSGFVFKNCKLIGAAKTYLGRAWGPNSRVIFYQTDMANIVVPEGWDYWRDSNKGVNTVFVESGCTGLGSRTSGRVKWEKTLSNEDLKRLTSISFIDDGWLSQQAW
ncbi:uncharacterized protein A4U43_C07F12650 [Asparagus officinalis]|uniref:Pectinesterase n=2 Tax=Asparagus officinalis TaxID=4686 RepID=A0A5P1EBI7_ASPOF|nr:uncharacterized protein A4U43_C07F12650 [Asparagus officinalis]